MNVKYLRGLFVRRNPPGRDLSLEWWAGLLLRRRRVNRRRRSLGRWLVVSGALRRLA